MDTSQRRVWTVEEVPIAGGGTAQRQSLGTLTNNPDESWHWNRPDDRLNEKQRAEWDRVMNLLKKVKGEDLRHVVCFSGLLDHCTGNNSPYSEPDKKSDGILDKVIDKLADKK